MFAVAMTQFYNGKLIVFNFWVMVNFSETCPFHKMKLLDFHQEGWVLT